jgi:prepilin-type N-terminal cleavage/methylation domain-containing protein
MNRASRDAFTLIEMLVVISIIIILMGLLFPAFKGVQDQAKRTQAKNDLTQIVTAVNAYYTEYGKYPLAPSFEQNHDVTFGDTSFQDQLLNVLRANGKGRDNPASASTDDNENPRRIAFITPPIAKDGTAPKNGISPDTGTNPGMFYDPWGKPYYIKIDGTYDNQLTNPYSLNAGNGTLNNGVLAWSAGKDGQTTSGTTHLDAGSNGNKTATTGADAVNADDVLSWQ